MFYYIRRRSDGALVAATTLATCCRHPDASGSLAVDYSAREGVDSHANDTKAAGRTYLNHARPP